MSFTIITPTYQRAPDILRRCLDSVNGLRYREWHQIIIVDDASFEGHVSQELMDEYASPQRTWMTLGYRANNWANAPRMKAILAAASDYIVFLDDDNIVFPNYLTEFVNHFRTHPDHGMAVCKILHCGPLPAHFGRPPAILDGRPPVLQNVDSLQICVRSEIAKQYGWLDAGYTADGATIQLWSQHCTVGFVDTITAVHL
jgi:glycosyltransferase involved in cell wall biosynthesis